MRREGGREGCGSGEGSSFNWECRYTVATDKEAQRGSEQWHCEQSAGRDTKGKGDTLSTRIIFSSVYIKTQSVPRSKHTGSGL